MKQTGKKISNIIALVGDSLNSWQKTFRLILLIVVIAGLLYFTGTIAAIIRRAL